MFAEGAVVVVSILLALGADASWTRLQLDRETTTLLTEIRATLEEDLVGIQQARDTMSTVRDVLVDAPLYFETGDLRSTAPEFQRMMYAMTRFTQVHVRQGPFETLKARGVDLVDDPSLRVRLISLYEDHLPTLQYSAELDQRLAREQVLPALVRHFELNPDNAWTLRSSEAEARSEAKTFARYRQRTLSNFYLPAYDDAISEMSETLAAIDRELR